MKAYFAWLAKFITVLVVLVIFVPLLIGSVIGASSMMFAGHLPASEPKVAVVQISGVILESKDILEQLYTHVKDEEVIGIVLDINSPGGAVGPSQAIYSTVQKLSAQKPIVAAMGSVAASGGLYAALGAKKIYAQPGTLTGSIGVILQLPNFSKITEEYGFQMITIKSGELKDVGNSFRPMTEADRDFLQASVNKVRDGFVKAVVDGRGMESSLVESIADGRIILGSEAVEYGLADGFGTVYDAARTVYELAGKSLEEDEVPNLFYEDDQFSKFREFFGADVFGRSIRQFLQLLSSPMQLS
ncbi:MAG: signal peptide peptidase SppA [Bdellovibrionales bacterium]|nr:signal peptide peptidase SppA [Bdellovibrionales bacterium]